MAAVPAAIALFARIVRMVATRGVCIQRSSHASGTTALGALAAIIQAKDHGRRESGRVSPTLESEEPMRRKVLAGAERTPTRPALSGSNPLNLLAMQDFPRTKSGKIFLILNIIGARAHARVGLSALSTSGPAAPPVAPNRTAVDRRLTRTTTSPIARSDSSGAPARSGGPARPARRWRRHWRRACPAG